MKKIKNYSVLPPVERSKPIRILLVDDQIFVRRFITKSLESDRNLQIIGTADNGQEAIAKVKSLTPDVVLIDLEMPQMDGITATEIIAKRFPDCKILVLSSHETGDYLQNALRAGAKGYLLKGSPATELNSAIHSVYKGYTQLSPGLLEKFLTPQVEVLPKIEEERDLEQSEAEDWSESTRETINTVPRVSLRAILYILLILLAGIIPWAMFAKIDEIGTAKGKLEPKGRVVNLDSPVNGTVMSIDVKEGQQVQARQSILKLESELVDSELQQQQQKLTGQQNQLNQLELLKNQQLVSLRTQEQQNKAQQFEKEALIDQAKQNEKSLKAAYNSQLAEKEALVDQAKEAIETSKSAHHTARIRYRAAQEKVPRYQNAYNQGALSKDLLAEAQQLAAETQESIIQTNSEIAQARSRYKEQQNGYEKLLQQTSAEIDLATLRVQEQQRGLDSLAQTNNLAILKSQEEFNNTEAQIATLKGEIAQTNSLIKGLEYQRQQRVLYAPVEGTIFQLPVKKPGAVIQLGQMVAQIAPKDSPLILRGRMSSRESGFLQLGLPVKVKFDAYPFQDYGIVSGRLSWVSPDSRIAQSSSSSSSSASQQQSNGTTSAESEFYEIEVELDQNYIKTGDRIINLTPGQTATAEIVIRQRRLADVFLSPFRSLQKGGVQL
jgi:hemolysin D